MTTTPEPTCAGALCGAYLNHSSVQGYCPACGGATLFLAAGGYVTCARLDCPAPDAASTLLEQDPLRTPLPDSAVAGRVVTAADIRRAETAADLAAERAAHEEHRRQLADALGQDGDADWPYLLRRAEQVVTARATWKNTAANLEADRDRLAAELADVRAAQERYEEEVVGRFNLQAIEDRRRAEKAERAADLLAGSHRRAEQAEAALALATAARDEAIVRAEATLTRVRDALAEVKRDRDLLDLDDEAQTFGDGMTDTLARIEAALGDDQPTPAATKPRITTHTYQGTGGPCAVDFYGQTCDAPRDDHDLIPDTEPELIPVLDYAIHRLFAAIRNALRARP